MIFIKKQTTPPQLFLDAIAGLENYEDLQVENREIITRLLLAEQGGLCAICERSIARFSPTIEHFLPQSIFRALQLSYYNLYVACSSCNGHKAHHLIPPYIFDPRFSPFYDILNSNKGIKPHFEQMADGKCRVSIPAATTNPKKILAEHHSAYILQATLDLMQQNRYEDNLNEKNSLIHLRGQVYKTLMPLLQSPNLTNEQLQNKYRNMKNSADYQEFISLVTFLFAKEFRRRGLVPQS